MANKQFHVLDGRYYLNADGQAVAAGDPGGVELFGVKGQRVPIAVAHAVGLVDLAAVKEAAEWSVAKDLAAAMGIVEEPDGEALQATAVALATAAEEALAAAQAAQEAADAKLLEEAEAAEAAKAEAEAEAEAEAKAAKDTQNKAAKTTRQKGGTT